MKKIIKKLLSVGMAVLIVCSVFPYVGFSVIAQAGKIDCFSYSISDKGEVTITSCDKTSSGEITVPDEIEGCPVTTIQRYAFQNCINVTGVILPETLEVIGEGSFFGSGIESIVIPDGVSVIPGVAFKGCKALVSVELPEGIVELGLHSLSGCSALTEVILPESLRVIRDAAFFECKELVSVNLPAGLTEIGADAFNGCIKLASDIVIPEGVTKINTNIFRNCYELNSLTLHDNITEIGAQPFLNCNKLQPIRLPENLVTVGSTAFYFQDVQLPLPSNIETIGYMAFYKAEFFDENGEKVSAINIPEKVKTIGKEAFSGSSVAGESAYVSIPASVESIGVDAFNYPVFDVDPENVYYSSDENGVLYDKGKTNIIRVPNYTDEIEYAIPDTVTTIEPLAFGACVFSKIIIPASVISIGDASFRSCAKTVFEVDEDNLYYASDEKGALYDKNFTTLIKYPQIEGDTDVVLPESVEIIEKYAFYANKIITSLTMGDNVVEIKERALSECDNLQEVHFSVKLEILGDYVFCGTNQNAFTVLDIPDSVTYIGMCAFDYTLIQTFTVPAGVTVLKGSLFSSCRNLESVVIHEGVTDIEGYAFQSCSALKDIYYCGSSEEWESITISENGNSSLTNATIHYNYGKISGTCGENLTWVFDEETGELAISGTGKMEDYSSSGLAPWKDYLSSILSVTISDGVESIGENTFYNCEALRNLNLGNGVKSIGARAFLGCTGLESVTIPDSVTSIGIYAFSNCNSLTNITVDEANTAYSSDEYGVLFDKNKTELILYPTGNTITSYTIPDSVINIEAYAFSDAVNLVNVTIPDGVTQIGGAAFYDCERLESVTIPKSVTSIGSLAFNGCDSLTSITVDEANAAYSSDEYGVLFNKEKTELIRYPAGNTREEYVIPESVTKIIFSSFSACPNLTSVRIGENVTAIGNSAFVGCSGLVEITIPDGVTKIDTFAFENCTSLENVTVPGSVTRMSSCTFRSCENLKSVIIEEGVNSIGYSEFFNCYALESVVIPESVTYIDSFVFGNCKKLADVYYCGSKEQWGKISINDDNYNNTYLLTNPTIHYNYGKTSGSCGETLNWSFDEESKVLSITGSGEMDNLASFEEYGWSSLKDQIEAVEFGNAVVSVGSNAFAGCPNLKEVYLSESIGAIGGNAFADCPSLSLITVSGAGFTAEESSFSGNDERLTMLYASSNTQAADYAAGKSIGTIPFSYDYTKKVMNFNGELTVYPDLPYLFLSKLVKANPTMEYLYFEKLVFHGVEPETFDVEELGNDKQAQYLTFNNLYLSLKKVKDGSSEGVKFSDFLTLLENGDYDSFMFELRSDEGKQQMTFEELWEKVTDHFVSSALRITSKIINFFRKIFR